MTEPTPNMPAPSSAGAAEMQGRFSREEWFKIMNGPGQAGAAVIAAGPSGLTGVLAEVQAIGRSVQELLLATYRTPLMEAIAHAYRNTPPEELRELQQLQAGDRPRNLQQVREQSLQNLRQTIWLVKAKTSPEDLKAYGELLVTTAQRVAEAATEGGFLGIGGVKVSEGEKAVIEEIRALLV